MGFSLFDIPLLQIREFIKDLFYRNRTERIKSRIDCEKTQLELINAKIETLRGLGYSNEEIRSLLGEDVKPKIKDRGS